MTHHTHMLGYTMCNQTHTSHIVQYLSEYDDEHDEDVGVRMTLHNQTTAMQKVASLERCQRKHPFSVATNDDDDDNN